MLVAALASGPEPKRGAGAPGAAEATARVRVFLTEAAALARRSPDVTGGALAGDLESALQVFDSRLEAAPRLAALEPRFESAWPATARALLAGGDAPGAILAWAALEALGRMAAPAEPMAAAARMFDALRLRGVVAEAAERLGVVGEGAWRTAARVRVALAHARSAPAAGSPRLDWLAEADAAWLTGVHEHDGNRYFVKEPFETLVWWMALPALLTLAGDASPSRGAVRALERDIAARLRAAVAAGYRLR